MSKYSVTIIGLIIALITSAAIGCGHMATQQAKEENSRVRSVYYNQFQFAYEIIEVDGTQYLVNYQGGIYPLVTDSTKTGK